MPAAPPRNLESAPSPTGGPGVNISERRHASCKEGGPRGQGVSPFEFSSERIDLNRRDRNPERGPRGIGQVHREDGRPRDSAVGAFPAPCPRSHEVGDPWIAAYPNPPFSPWTPLNPRDQCRKLEGFQQTEPRRPGGRRGRRDRHRWHTRDPAPGMIGGGAGTPAGRRHSPPDSPL